MSRDQNVEGQNVDGIKCRGIKCRETKMSMTKMSTVQNVEVQNVEARYLLQACPCSYSYKRTEQCLLYRARKIQLRMENDL